MIPQPIVELRERAGQAEKSALTVFLVGIAIACMCGWIVALLFARPLEVISQAADQVAQGDEPVEIAELKSKLVPAEFGWVQLSFNAMVRQLREHMIRINKLAYEDKVSGLANRMMLRNYVTGKITELQASGRRGLILFIDLDGFKAVNDNHGHDLGDELLRRFSVRLRALFDQIAAAPDDADEAISLRAQLAKSYLLARWAETISQSFWLGPSAAAMATLSLRRSCVRSVTPSCRESRR